MIDQSNRLFVCIYKHVFACFFVLFFFPIPTFPTFFPILSFMMRDRDKIIENLRRILFEKNEVVYGLLRLLEKKKSLHKNIYL